MSQGNSRPGRPDKGEADRPPTSADIARYAGVSRSTVSYVLNDTPGSRISDETRARVQAAADALGYAPHALASALRAGRGTLVLVTLPALPSGPLLTSFFDILAMRLHAHGYPVFFHADRAARGIAAARAWAALRPAGILVQADRLTGQALDVLRTSGIRAILAMGGAPSSQVSTLVEDRTEIGACAAAHLAATGHRHVAAVVPREPGLRDLGLARLAGVERIASARGLRVDQVDLAYDERDAARLIDAWSRQPRPTGVFAYNDEYALLLMGAALDAGMAIPDDMAIVGADDLPFCTQLRPRLTSVHLYGATYPNTVADTLHAMIQGHSVPLTTLSLLRPRIVVRESG